MKKPPVTFRGAVLRGPAAARTSTPPAGRAAKGEPRVRVGREVAGRGGKAVSVVQGLPLDEPALQSLATELKKLCGAGGAVRNGLIEIQGDHRDRLVAYLQKQGWEAKRSGG